MLKVEININYKPWKELKLSKAIRHIANTSFKMQSKFKAKKSEISVLLTNDEFIHELNKQYRNMDKPTNVLSFPLDDETMMGDIIVAFETVSKEANDEGKTFNDHFALMIVHGVLHLCGYDHIDDDEAEEMEALERDILKEIVWE